MHAKKKHIKLLTIVLVTLIVPWSAIFITDLNRCNCLEPPVFAIVGETVDDGGSREFYGLGYTVKIKYMNTEYGVSIELTKMCVLGKVFLVAIQ